MSRKVRNHRVPRIGGEEVMTPTLVFWALVVEPQEATKGMRTSRYVTRCAV